ncbi:MAG: response regulator [Alphaproteobacteria bacterium]|jgi:signal transduction histidine kinase/CheY-like chemotaxis protein|nr:response regulator [Alphaproteobacteria bacterium]
MPPAGSPHPLSDPTEDRFAALERENARLRKINDVLMDRVERSMDMQGSAFSLFQTSVTLGQVLRERTTQLSKAMNALAATNRELKTLNEQLEQENADRRAAEAAMREAKDEAERANLSKTKFLAAISHDLLQPLNAARLFVSALLESRLSPRNRRLVNSSASALEAVDGLLNTLLEMSRLDAGTIAADIRAVDGRALLTALAAEYEGLARARGLEFRHVPAGVTLETDPQLLSRIIRNFLSNAIRYTPSGRVLLGCRRRGGLVRIGVWDSGPGIPEDKLTVIFEEFQQAGQPAADGKKGLGLGLAIVHRIAGILDHPVHVRSRVGEGTLFAVDVPVMARPAMAAEPFRPGGMPLPVAGLAGLGVLVIDDDPRITAAMETLLDAWDCRVLTATSMAEAARQVRGAAGTVDVIIADYHLAEGPIGVEAIDSIQALLPVRAPAMLITGDRSTGLREEAGRRGYPVLNKPVKPAPLRAMLTHLLSTGSRKSA